MPRNRAAWARLGDTDSQEARAAFPCQETLLLASKEALLSKAGGLRRGSQGCSDIARARGAPSCSTAPQSHRRTRRPEGPVGDQAHWLPNAASVFLVCVRGSAQLPALWTKLWCKSYDFSFTGIYICMCLWLQFFGTDSDLQKTEDRTESSHIPSTQFSHYPHPALGWYIGYVISETIY